MIFEQHGNLLSHISVPLTLNLQVIGSDPVERKYAKLKVSISATTWRLDISLKIDFGKVILILGYLEINYVQLFSGVQKIKLMSSRHGVDKHISVLLSY